MAIISSMYAPVLPDVAMRQLAQRARRASGLVFTGGASRYGAMLRRYVVHQPGDCCDSVVR
jgi:hypothetical protein